MLRFDWSLSHRNRRKYYLSTKNKSCSSNQSWSGIPSSLYPTHHTPIPIPAEPASTLYHSSKTPRTNRCRATLSFVLTSAPLLLFTGQKETAFCPPAGCRRLECRPSHLPEPSQHPSGEKTCLRQTLGAQKSIVPRCTYGIEVLYSIYYCMIAVVRGIVYTAVVPGRVYSRVRVAQQTEACWAPRRAFGRAPWEDLRSARDICVAMCPKTLKVIILPDRSTYQFGSVPYYFQVVWSKVTGTVVQRTIQLVRLRSDILSNGHPFTYGI